MEIPLFFHLFVIFSQIKSSAQGDVMSSKVLERWCVCANGLRVGAVDPPPLRGETCALVRADTGATFPLEGVACRPAP
jgi:hypothetical protein